MLKVAINGAGRIGRACARLLLQREDIQLVAIADRMPADQLHYLLSHDSVHGAFDISQYLLSHDCALIESQTEGLYDFTRHGATVLLECSGHFLKASDYHELHQRGLKRVVLSAMPEDDSPVELIGVTPLSDAPVVSAGSCTSNALAFVTRALQSRFTIKRVMATSIHSYTADQRLLDGWHTKQHRYMRAAGCNIIPSHTMAAANLPRLLKEQAPKAAAIGLRVPLTNVCLMQAVFELDEPADAAQVHAAIEAWHLHHPHALALTRESKVSSDMIGTPYSAIVDTSLTLCSGTLMQLSIWHDNETGYAARVVELIPKS